MNQPYSHLATAIKWGLLASSVAVAAPTFAADDNQNGDVERIEVTGSRIKRTDLEGASPIIQISRSDIENTGELTVADVLRQSTLNTFGSYSESSGSTWQSQANINLRGAGADRTLVLVNGKRMPGSPTLGGTAVNINTLPMAAVERIEILSDGASAVYGSDAVAGVVNIILRKDYDGAQVTVGAGRPDHAGGDENNYSFVAGTSSEKSNTVFAFDHEDRSIIYDRDRWYTRSANTDADNFDDTIGLSIYARNILDRDTGVLRPLASCAGTSNMVNNGKTYDYGGGDAVCAYDPTSLSATIASLRKDNGYIHNAYTINDSLTLNTQAILSRVQSFGQFAGAAGYFNTTAPLVNDLGTTVTNGRVYYRFDEVGPRETTVTDLSQDYQASLNGNESWGEWEVGAHFNRAENRSDGDNYVNRPIVEKLVNAGLFNFNGNTQDIVDAIRQSTLQQDKLNFEHYFGGVSFDVDAGLSAPVGFYVGAEAYHYDYSSKVDAQSAANNVIGSAGGNAGGERRTEAVFFEASAPITDTFEVDVAGRYDHYGDFGSKATPKLSASWRPMDGLLVRGSWGKGFRAPALQDLYASPSFSADTAKDYVYCDANGISRDKCSAQQYNVTRTANEKLDAETSTFYNFGVAYDFNSDLGAKLDYYHLKIEDVITFVSLQDLVMAEVNGVSLPGTYIQRLPSGKIDQAQTAQVNAGSLETSGLDLNVYGKQETGIGTFTANFQMSYVLDYKAPEYFLGPVNDQAGRKGLPEYKAQLDLGWKYDVHSVNWEIEHTADTKEFISGDFHAYGHLPSYTIHTVSYNNELPWNATVTLGIRNVFDREPVLDQDNAFDPTLYSETGRVYYANYTQRF